MVCKNNDVTAEDWTNGPFWYPVLAAFCEMNDGSFKINVDLHNTIQCYLLVFGALTGKNQKTTPK